MRLAVPLALLLAIVAGPAPASPEGLPALDAFSAALDAQWDDANPAASAQRFRAELAQWPPGDPQALIVLTQIARTQGLRRQFADAHATLDTVAARLDGAPSLVRVRYLLERGRAFNSAGDPARAVPLFAEALSLADCNNQSSYAVDAAHMLGIAASPAERLDGDLRARAMAERASDARTQRRLRAEYDGLGTPDGYIYEELAEIALARGDAAGAKTWAAKAHALLEDDPDLKANEPARLARLAAIAAGKPPPADATQ
jgi:hypothetical protein